MVSACRDRRLRRQRKTCVEPNSRVCMIGRQTRAHACPWKLLHLAQEGRTDGQLASREPKGYADRTVCIHSTTHPRPVGRSHSKRNNRRCGVSTSDGTDGVKIKPSQANETQTSQPAAVQLFDTPRLASPSQARQDRTKTETAQTADDQCDHSCVRSDRASVCMTLSFSHAPTHLCEHPEPLVVQEAHGGDAQTHPCPQVLGRAWCPRRRAEQEQERHRRVKGGGGGQAGDTKA